MPIKPHDQRIICLSQFYIIHVRHTIIRVLKSKFTFRGLRKYTYMDTYYNKYLTEINQEDNVLLGQREQRIVNT